MTKVRTLAAINEDMATVNEGLRKLDHVHDDSPALRRTRQKLLDRRSELEREWAGRGV